MVVRGEGARRWGAAALAVSLAVHALVAALIWRKAARAPRRLAAGAVEFTIETRQPPPIAARPPSGPVPAAPARDLARRRRPEASHAGPERPAQASAPGPSPAPAPPADMLRMRRPGESLSLDWGTFQAVEGTHGGPPEAPSAGPRRDRDRQGGSTAERVAEMLAPSAEDNVRAGKVHPQFYDYLRDTKARFHPTLATVEKDAGAPKVAGFFKSWWQTYLKDLAARHYRPDSPEPTQEMEGAVELTCDICLTIRLGETAEIEVVHHSISDEVDQEAVTALRFAVAARPATGPLLPAGVKGDGKGTARACYRFSASARRLPPAAIGCAFDEVKLKAGCVWPLKKIFRSDVKLISAWPG